MTGGATRRRLLFLVSEDWYFWAHRLHLARAARDAGYEVVVATRVAGMVDRIAGEGFRLEPLAWRRGSLNPLRTAVDVLAVARLYRRVRPDILHHVSLKQVLIGSMAACLVRRVPILNAITGLGFVFTSRSRSARLLARILGVILPPLLRRQNTITLVENEDDRRFLVEEMGAPAERTVVNPGSGVDPVHFAAMPLPNEPVVTVACVARMLIAKGVADLVAASRILKARGVPHRLVLAGAPDPDSPSTIDEGTLRRWVKDDGVEWLGQVADVRTVWRRADIAALASHGGEGVPLSLVEAAACGRPIVATDIPGSRDIARSGVNALLVPPHAPEELADALARLIADRALREKFAAASLEIAAEFSAEKVVAATLALYDRLLGR